MDKPFHLQITNEALATPVFQIADSNESNRASWQKLPAFTQYGRVGKAKPGAVVWARHEQDIGPDGRRILMAAQRYGAGLSAVICLENLWRWRLAKDANKEQFDRFWRQLFRYLGQAGRESVAIHFADEEQRPHSDAHLVVEKQIELAAAPQTPGGASTPQLGAAS